MKRILLLCSSALLLAGCGGRSTPTPPPTGPRPVQGQPIPNFSWVGEPLTLWQQQRLYNFTYWVMYDPIQLAAYSQQSYAGNNRFEGQTYSLSGSSWRQDHWPTLVYSRAATSWVEQDASFTATEGPVGSAGIKTVYVTDASGTRYYSLQERDLGGLPIAQGIAEGFGDGRSLPAVIKNESARFSPGARAYTWVMDQVDPGFFIDRTHYVFTERNVVMPLKTCSAISSSCSATASSIDDAVARHAWILNGGQNVSIRLLDGGRAEVRYRAEDAADELVYQVSYRNEPATTDTPARLVFENLNASDPAVTAAVTRLLAIGNGQLAVYTYGDQAVRGTYVPAQTELLSKSYQYNTQAMDDILTKWSPAAPPTLK